MEQSAQVMAVRRRKPVFIGQTVGDRPSTSDSRLARNPRNQTGKPAGDQYPGQQQELFKARRVRVQGDPEA